MFAASKTDSVSGGPPDGQFNYVTMLLHGDGTNGAQNNTFLDSSTNNFTITRSGNSTQGSFSPYGSNWSAYFNASSSYLTAPAASIADFGTGDFIVEAWFNCASTTGNQKIFDNYNGNNNPNPTLLLNIGGAGKVSWYAGQTAVINSSSTFSVGVWNYVVVSRVSSTTKMFLNGTEVGSVSDTRTYAAGYTNVGIGAEANGGGSAFNGYISNLRVVKGSGVTSSTIPTTPSTAITNTVLLTCQSNRFIDNSSNAYTITANGTPSVQRFNPFGTSTAYSTSVIGGSGYFDKSGDYLDGPTNSAFAFGTGDFTLSAWVYIFNGTSAQIIWTNQTTSSASAPNIGFFILNNKVCINNTNTAHSESTGTIANNSWNYVGVTKSSGTYTFYINGSASGTTSSIGNNDFTENACRIGYGNYGTNFYFGGYITDLRVIKGSAVTPSLPTAPVGTVTNTQLLLNMTNGAIFDNAMMNDLETVGNAQISTSVKKYGTGSLSFDGTGDYLQAPDSPVFNLGSGNWTIESWIYLNSAKNYNGFYGKRQAGQFGLALQIDSSGVLSISASITGSSWALGGASLGSGYTTGAWMHVAVTRSGTTITGWLNGSSTGTQTLTGAIFPSIGYPAVIGSAFDTGSAQDLNGYMDDFRLTNGFCRYTTTFTPPTSALSDTGPY